MRRAGAACPRPLLAQLLRAYAACPQPAAAAQRVAQARQVLAR